MIINEQYSLNEIDPADVRQRYCIPKHARSHKNPYIMGFLMTLHGMHYYIYTEKEVC